MLLRLALAMGITMALCVGCTTVAELKNEQTINLWPDKAPGQLADTPADIPAIQVYVPAPGKATGASFVVCPGGGYGGLAQHEGPVVGRWFADNGITAFVLRYRLAPKYHHPAPLTDAQRAIRFVRSHSKDWGLDPKRIGIMGFSAGGHLTSTAATHYIPGDRNSDDPVERVSSRPDLQILIYPVITMGPGGHEGSKNNLLGKDASKEMINLFSNEKQVTKDTPPAFLMHSVSDTAVPVGNSDGYTAALKAAGVPFEYVRGELGQHGVGLQKTWTPQCIKWLQSLGFANKEVEAK
jgi:acetyl esterase/lipase